MMTFLREGIMHILICVPLASYTGHSMWVLHEMFVEWLMDGDMDKWLDGGSFKTVIYRSV